MTETQHRTPPQSRAVATVDAIPVVTRTALALIHTTSIEEPEWLQHPDLAQQVTEPIVRYLARPAP